MHGCSDASQAHLQSLLTEFIFGFDSDVIVRALLQLVCVEQLPWLVLPLQSMLSRLIVEHGQVACHFRTFVFCVAKLVAVPCTFVFCYSKLFDLPCCPVQLFQLIDIMCDSQHDDGDGASATDGAERDIVQDIIQVFQIQFCWFFSHISAAFDHAAASIRFRRQAIPSLSICCNTFLVIAYLRR
jgi:hypothetical protein